MGKFSFWVSGNYQDSHSQPLSYVTSATFPAGTTGGFAEQNKLGAAANVLGASGLLHTAHDQREGQGAYDFTPTLRAAYTFGFWQNDADASVDSYLATSPASPTFAGQAGFASGILQPSAAAFVAQPHAAHRQQERLGFRGRRHALSLRQGQAAHAHHRVRDRHELRHCRPRRRPRRHRLVDARPQGHVAAGGRKIATHTVSFGAHDDG